VKYIPNSAEKNISSEPRKMMTPTTSRGGLDRLGAATVEVPPSATGACVLTEGKPRQGGSVPQRSGSGFRTPNERGDVDDPNDWLDGAARALGEERLAPDEVTIVLRLARDVAHGVERKLAPLAAFLAGASAGRAAAGGNGDRLEALRDAAAKLGPLIPEPEAEGPGSSYLPRRADPTEGP
jgi:Domain of unknown function (DUF6457)